MTSDIGQLAISRKSGESFLVGDFTVTVLRVPGSRNTVELQVQAPHTPLSTKRLHADAKLHLTEDISIQAHRDSPRHGERFLVLIRAPKNIKILRSELISK